jgi:hypothetical protein
MTGCYEIRLADNSLVAVNISCFMDIIDLDEEGNKIRTA